MKVFKLNVYERRLEILKHLNLLFLKIFPTLTLISFLRDSFLIFLSQQFLVSNSFTLSSDVSFFGRNIQGIIARLKSLLWSISYTKLHLFSLICSIIRSALFLFIPSIRYNLQCSFFSLHINCTYYSQLRCSTS